MSTGQILTALWGYDAYDANLVHVHISGLRRKLEAHGPRILHTMRGIGYRLQPTRPSTTSPPRPWRTRQPHRCADGLP